MNMLEQVAKAAYEKFNENLIGCCEPSWEELSKDFKDRMIDAQRAAITIIYVNVAKCSGEDFFTRILLED